MKTEKIKKIVEGIIGGMLIPVIGLIVWGMALSYALSGTFFIFFDSEFFLRTCQVASVVGGFVGLIFGYIQTQPEED